MDRQRYFENPYEDYSSDVGVNINKSHVRNLIKVLVEQILKNTRRGDSRGDLYVGDSGELCHCIFEIGCDNQLFGFLRKHQVSRTCFSVFGKAMN